MSTTAIRLERQPLRAIGRACTWFLVAQLLFSGAMLIARPELVTTVVRHLGYPNYFPVLLGTAKLLAALAIVRPGSGTLAEWAYAGLTFDVIAVVVSHAALHDSAAETLAPLVVLAVIAGSYLLDPARREET